MWIESNITRLVKFINNNNNNNNNNNLFFIIMI